MFSFKFFVFVFIFSLLKIVQTTKTGDHKSAFRNLFTLPDPETVNEALRERGGLIWKRPDSLPFPYIWHTFKLNDPDTKEEVEYIIQDIPVDRYDEVLQLLADFTLKHEPTYVALKLWDDADAVKHLKFAWDLALKQKLSLACFRNGSSEIIGINILNIEGKDDEMYKLFPEDYVGIIFNALIELSRMVHGSYDIFKYSDTFLSSTALGIAPYYLSKSIPIDLEMIRTREKICKQFGIKLSLAIFSSKHLNKLADSLHFKIKNAISCMDIQKRIPRMKLPRDISGGITLRAIQYNWTDHQDEATNSLIN